MDSPLRIHLSTTCFLRIQPYAIDTSHESESNDSLQTKNLTRIPHGDEEHRKVFFAVGTRSVTRFWPGYEGVAWGTAIPIGHTMTRQELGAHGSSQIYYFIQQQGNLSGASVISVACSHPFNHIADPVLAEVHWLRSLPSTRQEKVLNECVRRVVMCRGRLQLISQALQSLKRELRAYTKGEEPFDRPQNPDETVRQWWIAIQRKSDGAVLAALAVKIYSITVTSIADERTMSAVTWLNSPRRSRQLIATVQNHIKIRDWHLYNPKNAAPKPAPTVQWRRVQADSKSGPGKLKINSQPSEVQIYDHMDIETGGVDRRTPLVGDVNRTAFAVPEQINIRSPSLLDMLSDKPVVPAITERDKCAPVLTQSMVKPKDEDWEM